MAKKISGKMEENNLFFTQSIGKIDEVEEPWSIFFFFSEFFFSFLFFKAEFEAKGIAH